MSVCVYVLVLYTCTLALNFMNFASFIYKNQKIALYSILHTIVMSSENVLCFELNESLSYY